MTRAITARATILYQVAILITIVPHVTSEAQLWQVKSTLDRAKIG